MKKIPIKKPKIYCTFIENKANKLLRVFKFFYKSTLAWVKY